MQILLPPFRQLQICLYGFPSSNTYAPSLDRYLHIAGASAAAGKGGYGLGDAAGVLEHVDDGRQVAFVRPRTVHQHCTQHHNVYRHSVLVPAFFFFYVSGTDPKINRGMQIRILGVDGENDFFLKFLPRFR